jgi:hypothetical protein
MYFLFLIEWKVGGGGLTVSGVSRNRGGFVKCVAIQKRLGIPAVHQSSWPHGKGTSSTVYVTRLIYLHVHNIHSSHCGAFWCIYIASKIVHSFSLATKKECRMTSTT